LQGEDFRVIFRWEGGAVPAAPSSPQAWHKRLSHYAKPDAARAVGQLLTTLVPLLASAAALFYGLAHGFWPALLCAIPAALFLVRLFIIQHDCGHGSYFASKRLNDALGRTLGVLTLLPYAAWRRDHAVHHATCGNLARRGIGDITTLTVAEYRARSRWQRLAYRAYRHPLVLFVAGPVYVLLLRYRLPIAKPFRDRRNWVSMLGTDAAAAMFAGGLAALIGPVAFLTGWITVLMLASATGVWFFYVQHQFEDTYWSPDAAWDFHDAALAGSSFYDLPRALHWLTGSIGFHHIHHLASRIPNYRLRACFDENPELQRAKRLTLWGSLKSMRLALWDEKRQKLVSFRQVARV
jgi:acyl-lipid omega-6 desaturase (Delta-12 desaturase)